MARVLIIDDDELFIKLMVHTLRQKGHEVDHALDGRAGTRLFERTPHDVVVCDIIMPEQEGVETIRLLREHKPDVGIVAISGGLSVGTAGPFDVLHIARQLGADTTLTKPFQLSALAHAVDDVLGRRQGATPPAASCGA